MYHVQLEGIALDPDAQSGVATIGSVDANNLAFSQTQAATQASQVSASTWHCCLQGIDSVSDHKMSISDTVHSCVRLDMHI